MLNELLPDLRELLDLVRQVENYDATVAANMLAGTPIAISDAAAAERKRKELRSVHLRDKWGI